MAAHRALCAAMVSGGPTRLDPLLADGYTLTHMTGYVQPKTEWLGEVGAATMAYHSIRDADVVVEVHPESATVDARTHTDATIWGSRNNWRLRLRTDFAPGDDGEVVALRTVASTW